MPKGQQEKNLSSVLDTHRQANKNFLAAGLWKNVIRGSSLTVRLGVSVQRESEEKSESQRLLWGKTGQSAN